MIHLVIADDEPGIRAGLSTLYPWEELGIRIVCLASNGQKALDYIRQHEVHLLVSDIRMPVMDGLELARQVHAYDPGIRIIMLSAYADFNYARTALRYGVSQYITKPVVYDEFRNIIAAVCASIPSSDKDTSGEGHYLGYYHEIIEKVKSYAKEDLSAATLAGAALRTGLSANYLSQIFSRYEQQTFSDYLTGKRMELAASLLSRHVSAEDTAWQCGYNSIRAFTQVFRNHYGVTPSIYQKAKEQED